MSKITIIDGNSNDKDNIRVIMVKGEKGDKGDTGDPTKLSQLENDVGFITSEEANLQNYYNKSEIDATVQEINETIDEKADTTAIEGEINDINDTLSGLSANITNEIYNRNNADNILQSQINGLASGSPLVASSTAGMTNTNKIYVNTTDGYWYYYNGTAWTRGGIYQTTGLADGSVALNNLDMNLKNDISSFENLVQISKNNYYFNKSLYKYGIYGNQDIPGNRITLRTINFFNINNLNIKKIVIKGTFANDIDIGVTLRTTNDFDGSHLVYDTGWKNSNFEIDLASYPTANYICFGFRNHDNSDFTTLDVLDNLAFDIYTIGNFDATKIIVDNLRDMLDFHENEKLDLLSRLRLNDLQNLKYKSEIFNCNYKPLVAHRGYSAIAPENTLPAFEEAGRAGFWGCETDVQETSDGYFILCHNLNTEWATGTNLVIAESTYAQINALTINNGNNISQYAGLKIPLLEDYLKICKKFGMIPFIDSLQIHSDSSWNNFFSLLDKYDLRDKCVFTAYQEPAKLTKIREYTIKSPVILNVGNDWSGNSDYFLGLLNNWKNSGLAVNYVNINSTQIQLLRNNKSIIGAWTIDDLEDANNIIGLGADYIATNSLISLFTEYKV